MTALQSYSQGKSHAAERPHRGLTILAISIIEESDYRGVTQKCLIEFDIVNKYI